MHLSSFFDEIHIIRHRRSRTNIISGLFKALFLTPRKCDTFILSNPILVVNQFIWKKLSPNKTIMLEDGTLNYTNFTPNQSKVKYWMQRSLNINQDKLLNTIKKTYLFDTHKANFFFGVKERMEINLPLIKHHVNLDVELAGKKLFIGTPLYRFGMCDILEYSEAVNRIGKKLGVDYYIPHWDSSDQEVIDFPILDLNQYCITIELLAFCNNFSLYSFNSSVLYTSKIINPHIKSYLIKTEKIKVTPSFIVENSVDDIHNL